MSTVVYHRDSEVIASASMSVDEFEVLKNQESSKPLFQDILSPYTLLDMSSDIKQTELLSKNIGHMNALQLDAVDHKLLSWAQGEIEKVVEKLGGSNTQHTFPMEAQIERISASLRGELKFEYLLTHPKEDPSTLVRLVANQTDEKLKYYESLVHHVDGRDILSDAAKIFKTSATVIEGDANKYWQHASYLIEAKRLEELAEHKPLGECAKEHIVELGQLEPTKIPDTAGGVMIRNDPEFRGGILHNSYGR